MDAKVIKPFFDLKAPENVYAVGDVFTGSAERVRDLINRGFLEEPKPKAPRKRTVKKEQ